MCRWDAAQSETQGISKLRCDWNRALLEHAIAPTYAQMLLTATKVHMLVLSHSHVTTGNFMNQHSRSEVQHAVATFHPAILCYKLDLQRGYTKDALSSQKEVVAEYLSWAPNLHDSHVGQWYQEALPIDVNVSSRMIVAAGT